MQIKKAKQLFSSFLVCWFLMGAGVFHLHADSGFTQIAAEIEAFTCEYIGPLTAYDIVRHFAEPPSVPPAANPPTFGDPVVFNAVSTDDFSCAALNSTSFVVVYSDNGNSGHGTAIVGTVAGNVISFNGSEVVFNAANVNNMSCAALNSTSFVVAYQDTGNSHYGATIVGTVAGNSISFDGSEALFNAAVSADISCTVLNSTSFVVVYRDVGNSEHGTAIVGTVSNGFDIAFSGSEVVFNAAFSTSNSCAVLNSTSFVVAYTQMVGLTPIMGKPELGQLVMVLISPLIVLEPFLIHPIMIIFLVRS